MIKYIDGDLLELADQGFFDVIVHGCNCFCTMGSGLAPQIKSKYPEAYSVDCETTSGDIKKLGGITYTKNTIPIVVNAYSQYDYRGRKIGKMDLDYKALESALNKIKILFSGKRIGLPKIGSGLAGGDFNIIEGIIKSTLVNEDVTIVNFK